MAQRQNFSFWSVQKSKRHLRIFLYQTFRETGVIKVWKLQPFSRDRGRNYVVILISSFALKWECVNCPSASFKWDENCKNCKFYLRWFFIANARLPEFEVNYPTILYDWSSILKIPILKCLAKWKFFNFCKLQSQSNRKRLNQRELTQSFTQRSFIRRFWIYVQLASFHGLRACAQRNNEQREEKTRRKVNQYSARIIAAAGE